LRSDFTDFVIFHGSDADLEGLRVIFRHFHGSETDLEGLRAILSQFHWISRIGEFYIRFWTVFTRFMSFSQVGDRFWRI